MGKYSPFLLSQPVFTTVLIVEIISSLLRSIRRVFLFLYPELTLVIYRDKNLASFDHLQGGGNIAESFCPKISDILANSALLGTPFVLGAYINHDARVT